MVFTPVDIVIISLIFIWIGFVRTGLGFGGAVLGLPLLMLVGGSPIDWLPIIGIHLLFFSGIALAGSLKKVDWSYLKQSLPWILPAKIIGVIGLISLPPTVMTVIVYSITSFYALTWIMNFQIASREGWGSRLLLMLGGYISGTSLNGAPLLVAVYMQNVDVKRLRNTLFVLWFLLVTIKMGAFLMVNVYINWKFSLMLIPVAGLGHYVGLKVHDRIIENDTQFKKWMGSVLIIICIAGLSKALF
ncbi:sulfite exporter TauE/SafE family protein [Candidatus Pseudothioglobus singularis]|nr:sulfite exporter TauE/SafE family protein [Candidatus Pseudothioglobus singularis]